MKLVYLHKISIIKDKIDYERYSTTELLGKDRAFPW